jgi:hypothetical protein
MSDMEPHMICRTLGCVMVKSWLGCVEVDLPDRVSVMVRLRDAIESVNFEEMS